MNDITSPGHADPRRMQHTHHPAIHIDTGQQPRTPQHQLDDAYRPSVRAWQKYKPRERSDAIVGAITGSHAVHRTLLLGR
ncbi:hypothetical protein [Streptomyces sp. NPDC047042]|uniref:hypothetical protein n=1 Tax=Streptomyces sp. NPDC047042 TaxID=3154807 RepID=UPI0033D485E2